MDKHYTANSVAEKGTLYNIKSKFLHKNIKSKVMENIQKVYDLVQFSCEGLVCILAMDILGMQEMDARPASSPADECPSEVEKEYLLVVSKLILDRVKPIISNLSSNLEEVPGDFDEDDDNDFLTFCDCETPMDDLDGMCQTLSIFL